MLLTEWNLEDAIACAREEGREEGQEKGRKEGREDGFTESKLIIACNLLSKGSTPEFVSEITGLSLEEIEQCFGDKQN